MQVTICAVGCRLPISAVRTSTVVVCVRQATHNFWQYNFIYVARREVGLAEVHLTRLDTIVKLELERFGDLVVFVVSSYTHTMSTRVILVSKYVHSYPK